ncbi:NAD(P)/FAD-dependent oxidoreductase [Candidatus Saccharibacteria bacterium]|nr:NAD(P)/FAD-dependent oxidoreductase [Candidatus Saccharibacteria bacterium]
MKKTKFDFDLIVLGSGAGGSAAANIAAKNGLKVAIVEKDIFGGESPNYGDIPIKTLLHAANAYAGARRAARYGILSNTLGYNFPTIAAWKKLVVKRTGAHDNQKFYEASGIKTYRGNARFITPNEISVNRQHISAEKFIIATGSELSLPDISNIQNVNYHTTRTILDITRPPKSIFIVGGGAEAIEISQLLAIFGTKVYISEVSSRLLPQEDEEVGLAIENILVEEMKIFVLPQTRVVAVEKDGLGKKVIFQRGGVEKFIKVDEILIAGNKKPATDIGLENALVDYTDSGITVNEFLQTSAKHIYAAGSVTGSQFTTGDILLQSRICAHNIIKTRSKISPNYTSSPRVIFTWPEVASVGLTEDDCIKRDLQFKTSIATLNLIARSNTDDFKNGFVKLICDKRGKLIGASVVSPEATSIIHEIGLAIKYDLYASDLADLPHAFLSWNEAIRVAANRIR